jgi:transglycosylase-like protein with SLT domain
LWGAPRVEDRPSPLYESTMRLALMFIAVVGTASADVVTFPLVIEYPLVDAALARQLHADHEGTIQVSGTPGSCRYVTLREPHAGPGGGRLELIARGDARLGFGILGLCIAPVAWDGYLETLATPTIGPDWQLRLRDLDSHVSDRERRRTIIASRLWDVVKGRAEAAFADFAFDLGPPVDAAKALVRTAADPDRARQVLQALDTLRPAGVEVTDAAVRVLVSVDLPPSEPGTAGPEPALAPIDLARWQGAVESWDGFLVFVVEHLGAQDADPAIRDRLLEILLESRQRLLAVLAGGPEPGIDPVRELFLEAWEGIRTVARQAAAHGRLDDRALRYIAFLTAGDALAALDRAGPSLGLEISADGLRRLARLLDPEFVGDPVAYTDAPDERLRELFHFHDPAGMLPPSPADSQPPDAWWWIGPPRAWAADVDELAMVRQRLDHWVPETSELPTYRDLVARLLTSVTERTAATNGIVPRFADLYRHLVPATAWQESCWRQFVKRGGRITYLLSTSGDIGIMQVNRRVWRGFFDIGRLQNDIAYNAGAGAEVLAQLLTRYGAREADQALENAARATYAAYNGGPDAFRRYRARRVPRAQQAIDHAFWEKYQAMAAGRALDFVLCIENWGAIGRARLSTEPLASTPKRCIRSRSSLATLTTACRHASIASRPRASFV